MFIILKTVYFQFWLSYKSDLCILFILKPAGTNLGIIVQIRVSRASKLSTSHVGQNKTYRFLDLLIGRIGIAVLNKNNQQLKNLVYRDRLRILTYRMKILTGYAGSQRYLSRTVMSRQHLMERRYNFSRWFKI